MKLITNKSKNLLYCISVEGNVTVQFGTSYAVATQRTADSASVNTFKIQGWDGTKYTGLAGANIAIGKLTTTFTTPSTTGFKLIRFGLNGASIDTLCRCEMDLKPSTTYTFTCNFTNITQGSISWKDMMLVEGSTAGEYEPYSYNLLDKYKFLESNSYYINNGDGSITTTGTVFSFQRLFIDFDSGDSSSISKENSIAYLTYGHKILIDDNGNSTGTGWSNAAGYVWELNGTSVNAGGSYGGKGEIFTNNKLALADIVRSYFYMKNNGGEVVTCAPALYDLTLMYGAGNEPTTVNQFYTDHPELKVSPLGFIGLKNLEISNKNIKRLKYKTWNNSLNLVDKSKFNHSDVAAGVTFTNNGDGSWTVNGTSTSQIYLPLLPVNSLQLNTAHKYLLSGCPKEGSSNLFLYVDNGGALFDYDTGSGSIGNPTKTSAHITISVSSNTTVNNAIFKPALYDLTEIYGAGNEPTTVEQFYKDYPLTKTSPLGFSDLGIIPSNSGYVIEEFSNLSEELLKENIEIDNVTYHIPDKTNISLNKIEGKTNKIVQLADKSEYDPTRANSGITLTNNGNGTYTINGTCTASDYADFSFLKNTYFTNDWLKGHKYLLYFSDKEDLNYYAVVGGNTSKLEYSELGYTLRGTRTPMWKILEPTETSIGGNSYFILRVRHDATCTNELASPQVFDLTSMYGFGKEPTTVEQFKKDYPQFFDEKLDGIWNVRTSGISSTGKNLFDISKWIISQYDVANGTLVERLSNGAICQGDNGTGDGDGRYSNGWFRPMSYQYPNSIYLQAGTYTLSADYTMIENSVVNTANVNCYLYGDHNYTGSSTSVTVGNTVKVKNTYTVEEGYYYPVFTLNSGKVKIENIQIELNSTATSYEHYQENKIDLLSTQTLNGINGVNDYIEVIDKGNGLYDLKKTQNIARVDMGSLGFDVDGNNFYTGAISIYIKPPVNDNSVGNYSCQKYVNCAISKSFVDGDFGVNSSGVVYFRNSAYTKANEFQTAMSGTILYYQLKTPVVTTIATNLTYNQVSAIRTNGGLLLVNDNNNQKYVQPDVTLKENYQYKN